MSESNKKSIRSKIAASDFSKQMPSKSNKYDLMMKIIIQQMMLMESQILNDKFDNYLDDFLRFVSYL